MDLLALTPGLPLVLAWVPLLAVAIVLVFLRGGFMLGRLFTTLFVHAVVIFLALPFSSFASTTETSERSLEVGGLTPIENEDPQPHDAFSLNNLGTELDISLGYLMLTGEGLDDLYSGIPQIGAGVSFLITPHIRNFFRVEYGQVSGNPFQNIPGFDSPDDTTVRSVAMTMGLRFNMSQNKKLRFEMGFGIQSAWQQEETIGNLSNGDIGVQKASGFNFGLVSTVGPTLLLGENENLLGLELGFGGSKGDVHGDGYSHEIDITGVSARIFYVFKL